MEQERTVRDFMGGLKAFGKTLLVIVYIVIALMFFGTDSNGVIASNEMVIGADLLYFIVFVLSIVAFVVNYTPLKIKNGKVIIPARDQIRTFTDLIILNSITGYFRRRVYDIEDIEDVANGYTRPGKGNKNRKWNVVITGMHNDKSFSQRIDVSNKQVRDEVRNALKQTINGHVNSEFSY